MMTTAEADEYAATMWRRSRKGNLTRVLTDGMRVTVFHHHGMYGYCIGKGNNVRFSKRLRESERETMKAAMEDYING